jgi:hypothetical protein
MQAGRPRDECATRAADCRPSGDGASGLTRIARDFKIGGDGEEAMASSEGDRAAAR